MGAKFIMNKGHGTAATSVDTAALNITDETNFQYMFREDADHNPIVDGSEHLLPADDAAAVRDRLERLGDEVGASDSASTTSAIPPVYTYWGQFIDHDVTANTDRENMTSMIGGDFSPQPRDTVEQALKNLRDPLLGLDSLYGDGPHAGSIANEFEMYQSDGVRFRIGTASDVPSQFLRGIPAPAGDLARDLPRDINKKLPGASTAPATDRAHIKAAIGDHRNDENLVVAQFHLGWLRFHNAVADWVEQHEHLSGPELFHRARDLVRWHYQWLVVNDYLKTICNYGTVDKILHGGLKHFDLCEGEVAMPLEFSVAAFRFGHSMVRAEYDFNVNFSNVETNPVSDASFEQLFLFTGGALPRNAALGGADSLPKNWIIDWARFVDHNSALPERFARPVDARLAPPLANMDNVADVPANIFKNLSRRNLLRGYLLGMPTGQAVAGIMGIAPLSESELLSDASSAEQSILQEDNGAFLNRTPLWYYILKEAQVRAQGHSLGPVGSTIVAETIIGLVTHDQNSYLNGGISSSWQPGDQIRWSPADGVKLPDGSPVVTIADMLTFAGVYVP